MRLALVDCVAALRLHDRRRRRLGGGHRAGPAARPARRDRAPERAPRRCRPPDRAGDAPTPSGCRSTAALEPHRRRRSTSAGASPARSAGSTATPARPRRPDGGDRRLVVLLVGAGGTAFDARAPGAPCAPPGWRVVIAGAADRWRRGGVASVGRVDDRRAAAAGGRRRRRQRRVGQPSPTPPRAGARLARRRPRRARSTSRPSGPRRSPPPASPSPRRVAGAGRAGPTSPQRSPACDPSGGRAYYDGHGAAAGRRAHRARSRGDDHRRRRHRRRPRRAPRRHARRRSPCRPQPPTDVVIVDMGPTPPLRRIADRRSTCRRRRAAERPAAAVCRSAAARNAGAAAAGMRRASCSSTSTASLAPTWSSGYARGARPPTPDALACGRSATSARAGPIGARRTRRGRLDELQRRRTRRARPARRTVDGAHDRHELFWSLTFGVSRSTRGAARRLRRRLRRLRRRGHRPRAARARSSGLPLAWFAGGTAYHQWHPPTRLDPARAAEIVANARRFRRRWGRWPMEGWLQRARRAGVSRLRPGGDVLELAELR